MRKDLHEITAFSSENFSLAEAAQEFNAKFANGWLFVNDKLEFVKELVWDEPNERWCLRIHRNLLICEADIKSLKPFKPKVGSYFTSTGLVVVFSKTARKMYKKTLSIGENYNMTVLDPIAGTISYEYDSIKILSALIEDRVVDNLGFISKNRQIVLSKGLIYFCGVTIGSYTMTTLRSLLAKPLPLWEQELKDLFTYELEG